MYILTGRLQKEGIHVAFVMGGMVLSSMTEVEGGFQPCELILDGSAKHFQHFWKLEFGPLVSSLLPPIILQAFLCMSVCVSKWHLQLQGNQTDSSSGADKYELELSS